MVGHGWVGLIRFSTFFYFRRTMIRDLLLALHWVFRWQRLAQEPCRGFIFALKQFYQMNSLLSIAVQSKCFRKKAFKRLKTLLLER